MDSVVRTLCCCKSCLFVPRSSISISYSLIVAAPPRLDASVRSLRCCSSPPARPCFYGETWPLSPRLRVAQSLHLASPHRRWHHSYILLYLGVHGGVKLRKWFTSYSIEDEPELTPRQRANLRLKAPTHLNAWSAAIVVGIVHCMPSAALQLHVLVDTHMNTAHEDYVPATRPRDDDPSLQVAAFLCTLATAVIAALLLRIQGLPPPAGMLTTEVRQGLGVANVLIAVWTGAELLLRVFLAAALMSSALAVVPVFFVVEATVKLLVLLMGRPTAVPFSQTVLYALLNCMLFVPPPHVTSVVPITGVTRNGPQLPASAMTYSLPQQVGGAEAKADADADADADAEAKAASDEERASTDGSTAPAAADDARPTLEDTQAILTRLRQAQPRPLWERVFLGLNRRFKAHRPLWLLVLWLPSVALWLLSLLTAFAGSTSSDNRTVGLCPSSRPFTGVCARSFPRWMGAVASVSFVLLLLSFVWLFLAHFNQWTGGHIPLHTLVKAMKPYSQMRGAYTIRLRRRSTAGHVRDAEGNSVTHVAAVYDRTFDQRILHLSMQHDPTALMLRNFHGDTPLHVLLKVWRRAAYRRLRFNHDFLAESTFDGSVYDPVDAAAYDNAIGGGDSQPGGWTPWFGPLYAAMYYMLTRDPAVASVRDFNGLLPLHLAVLIPNIPFACLRALAAAFPEGTPLSWRSARRWRVCYLGSTSCLFVCPSVCPSVCLFACLRLCLCARSNDRIL